MTSALKGHPCSTSSCSRYNPRDTGTGIIEWRAWRVQNLSGQFGKKKISAWNI